MALHSKDNFIRPISDGDKYLFIQDVNRVVTSEINPWRVTASYVLQNTKYVTVKTQATNYPINILFSTYQEAMESLVILQESIQKLKSVTDDVSDSTKDYIDKIVTETLTPIREEYPGNLTEQDGDLLFDGIIEYEPIDSKVEVYINGVQYLDSYKFAKPIELLPLSTFTSNEPKSIDIPLSDNPSKEYLELSVNDVIRYRKITDVQGLGNNSIRVFYSGYTVDSITSVNQCNMEILDDKANKDEVLLWYGSLSDFEIDNLDDINIQYNSNDEDLKED